MLDGIKGQNVFKNLEFFDLPDDHYGSYACKRLGYTGSVMGLAHEGMIYYFTEGDNHYFVSQQQAVEDRAKNKAGFEMIMETFEIDLPEV